MALGSGLANASQTDCLSYSYVPPDNRRQCIRTCAWIITAENGAQDGRTGYHNLHIFLTRNGGSSKRPEETRAAVGQRVDWAAKSRRQAHPPHGPGSITWVGKGSRGKVFGHVPLYRVEKVSGSRVTAEQNTSPVPVCGERLQDRHAGSRRSLVPPLPATRTTPTV